VTDVIDSPGDGAGSLVAHETAAAIAANSVSGVARVSFHTNGMPIAVAVDAGTNPAASATT
jgi:hypothetical protein